MKTFLVLLILFPIIIFAQAPTIDGVFDGESVWGAPVATADGVEGWNIVNVNKLYVTYDASYAYFAASFNSGGAPAGWHRGAFAINVTSGGGSSCPWGAAVSYGYANKPDFVLVCRFGDNWAELRNWTGSSWGGGGTNIRPSDMNWAGDFSYVEGRISQATLGFPVTGDIQFYVSGNNWDQHGTFDAVPDDVNMTSWNNPTTLNNYALGPPLPIQLASFVGYFVNSNDVTFEWETISEIKNYGFWIQKRNPVTDVFTTIEESFQPGQGVPSTYKWTYANAVIDNTEFYLLQQDNDGLTSRFGPIMLNPTNVPVEALPSVFALNQNYPNPFNPSTVINYQLAVGNYTTLKVYNIIGKEVATLVNGYQAAGYHQVTFDASHLSNGIYFYKLQSGNNVEVRKLTLMK